MADSRPGVKPLIGVTIDDKIQIESVIGSGGMGVVYKAFHKSFERPVAVKVLSFAASALDPSIALRFRAEATSLQRLDHPNVVKVYSFDLLEDSSPYLVLEYLDGGSLSDRLSSRTEGLTLQQCWELFEQMAEGLAHAHSQNIVHRDIKPANVMFSSDGKLKLVDFGVAKSTDLSAQKLTQTGSLLGTPLYMSPELLAGQKPGYDSDIYSIGCVMFECLFGRRFVEGESLLEIAMNQSELAGGDLPKTTMRGEDVPQGLSALLTKALHSDRTQRIQNGSELLTWIKRVRLEPNMVPQQLHSEKVDRPQKRLKARQITLPASAALVAMAIVVTIGFVAYKKNQTDRILSHLNDALQETRSASGDDAPRWQLAKEAIEEALPYAKNDTYLSNQLADAIRIMSSRLLQKHASLLASQNWILQRAADLQVRDSEERRMRIAYCNLLVLGAGELARLSPTSDEHLRAGEKYLDMLVDEAAKAKWQTIYKTKDRWGLAESVSGAADLAKVHYDRMKSTTNEAATIAEREKALSLCRTAVLLTEKWGQTFTIPKAPVSPMADLGNVYTDILSEKGEKAEAIRFLQQVESGAAKAFWSAALKQNPKLPQVWKRKFENH